VSCKVALRYGEDIISSTDLMDLAAVVARKKESKCSFISVLSMVQMKRERGRESYANLAVCSMQ
jgi:hypothetical protein